MLAWLFARSAGSRFVLRVDDLDPADARPEHEARQLADLAAIGLDWDEPVVHQAYARYRQAMLDMGVTIHELSPRLVRKAGVFGDFRSSLTLGIELGDLGAGVR